jgi:large subunit ribosomal protein L7/L12
VSVTRQEIFAYIKGLSLPELTKFISELQEELGVAPAPAPYQVTMGVAPPIVGGVGPDEFDVYLLEPGAARIHVIKAVRQLLGVGLAEGKSLVESAPVRLKEALSRAEAELFVAQLAESGAKAELRPRP